jgi:acyl-coenzyme A synthetase/AMP-(fatty) acid ligase
MIQINDRIIDRAHFDATSARAGEAALLGQRQGDRFAVCFSEAEDWLALFFAIRAAGASVLPIHPATPYAAARRLAEAAGCNWLFYNRWEGEAISEQRQAGSGKLIQMSSGTTGAPKCVERSWADVDREIESYVSSSGSRRR